MFTELLREKLIKDETKRNYAKVGLVGGSRLPTATLNYI